MLSSHSSSQVGGEPGAQTGSSNSGGDTTEEDGLKILKGML